MDRKEFFKTCGYACLSGVAISTLFTSCNATSHLDLESQNSQLAVNESEFEMVKKGKTNYRKYVLVHTTSLPFPICLFRNDGVYTALLLKCSHQGAELQVFGDRIVCPAHGSEFNKNGGVEEGPAIDSLQSFPTEIKNGQIIISLA